MVMTGAQFEISAGEHWAAASEVGANLRGYRVAGVDVTHVHDPAGLPPKSNGAVLMPWPNRVRGGRFSFDGQDLQLILSDPVLGNASHGLGCWARWRVDEHRPDEVRLSCDLVPQKGWPFEVRAQVSYRVDAYTGLTVTLGAHNTGASAVPFGAGSHPYLSTGSARLDEVQLRVPATSRLLTDDAQIPTGALDVRDTDYDLRQLRALGSLRLDTAFVDLQPDRDRPDRGSVSLRTADRDTTLWWDHPAFSTVQVFTVAELSPGHGAIAIEPMTCPAEAFNSGDHLLRLEPGASWSGCWGIAG